MQKQQASKQASTAGGDSHGRKADLVTVHSSWQQSKYRSVMSSGAAGVMSGTGDSISPDQSCRSREVLRVPESKEQNKALPLLANWPNRTRVKIYIIYIYIFLQGWRKTAEYAAVLPKLNIRSLSDELGGFLTKTVQTLSYISLTTQ